MKVVEKVVKINKELLKAGQIVEMEDTLSCDKFRAIVRSVDDFKVSLLRLKDTEQITLSAEQLENYEVRHMQLGYVGEYKPKLEPKNTNQDVSATKDSKVRQEKRQDRTCEYNVFEDLINQLARNYEKENRKVKW